MVGGGTLVVDPRGVIAQECFPTLGGRSLPPDHVPRHGRFGDFDAEHEQFAVYPWRSPQWVFLVHPSDEIVDLAVDSGAATTPAGFPAPIGAKAAPMPADHGLRLNDRPVDLGMLTCRGHDETEQCQEKRNRPVLKPFRTARREEVS